MAFCSVAVASVVWLATIVVAMPSASIHIPRNFSSIPSALNKPHVNAVGGYWPIQNGFVSFGDSYAAGMGTGRTSSDSCRVGELNVAELLRRYTDKDGIDVQAKMCSGDTVTGLQRQITEWSQGNPQIADIATVSIGGNDLRFSKLLKMCILNIFWSLWWQTNCETAINDAYLKMRGENESPNLKEQISESLDAILAVGNPNLHIYVTAYVPFFNADTTTCNQNTFFWWQTTYAPGSLVQPPLAATYRKKVNDLVADLNDFLSGLVNDVNTAAGIDRVHFVNPGNAGENHDIDLFHLHRFCENNNAEPQPDYSRAQTDFFLGGFANVYNDIDVRVPTQNDDPDVATVPLAEDGTAELSETIQEVSVVVQHGGSIDYPDPDTCETDLGPDADPYKLWDCEIAIALRDDQDGNVQDFVDAAMAELKAGDVNGQHIPWILPTVQAKTFHPRSTGMLHYLDALIDEILLTHPV